MNFSIIAFFLHTHVLTSQIPDVSKEIYISSIEFVSERTLQFDRGLLISSLEHVMMDSAIGIPVIMASTHTWMHLLLRGFPVDLLLLISFVIILVIVRQNSFYHA